jgi:hypothetical protein
MAAGGDTSRLWRVGGTTKFDPRYNMPELIEATKLVPNLKAILIDPVVAVSKGDSHKGAETRHDLQPLVDLAQERHAVVIGITHLSKGTANRDPIERVTGSLAFGAVPRVVLFVVKGVDEEAPRRLVRVASNIGPSGDGFEFTIVNDADPKGMQNQHVVWGVALKGSPHKLVEEMEATAPKGPKRDTALERAKAFILATLAQGPAPTKEIEAAAGANGIAKGTLHRAYGDMIEVVAETIPGSRAWQWRLVDPMARKAGFAASATTH